MIQYYAVWQVGGPVYGVGTTEHEAIENSLEWLDPDPVFKEGSNYYDGDLVVFPCSLKLAKTVMEEGGDVQVTLEDEYLILENEL